MGRLRGVGLLTVRGLRVAYTLRVVRGLCFVVVQGLGLFRFKDLGCLMELEQSEAKALKTCMLQCVAPRPSWTVFPWA